MRILFTTESYYPIIDGGAIGQHRIVHELIKKGHDVHVIAPNISFKNTQEDDNGSTIYRTRGLLLPFYMNNKYHFPPFPLPHIHKIIKAYKPDIINVCSPYPNSLSALIIAKKYHIPTVGSIHILPENILAPFLHHSFYETLRKKTWSYLIWFYNKVNWATIPTETGATLYKKKGLHTPITPISNGVNTTMFNPKNNGEYLRKRLNLPKKNIVLYTGRINQEKNLDVLINAIPKITKEIDAHFLFCGSGGYKTQIQRLTKELHVEQQTTFIDFLSWEDYPNIFSLADIFAIPAESELQSLVTLEAIASGLPVVVVNKGAVPELASAGNGYTFEPGNSTQMAHAIIKILRDKKLQKTMQEKSLQLAQQHSMENVAKQYENVYTNLLKNLVKK